MAAAHKWHNESMAALYAMQNENGWADDDEDFVKRKETIKEIFNKKFDAELVAPEPPVCLKPEDYLVVPKGKDKKRKKKVIPPWKEWCTLKAKDIPDVIKNHGGKLPAQGKWVTDRESPNADAEGGKAAMRFCLKDGGKYIIRVIEDNPGKKYKVMVAPANYRELHEKKLAAAALEKAAKDESDNDEKDPPAAAPVAAPEAASSSSAQVRAPVAQASPPTATTRASRSRTAAGEAAAAAEVPAPAPEPAPANKRQRKGKAGADAA